MASLSRSQVTFFSARPDGATSLALGLAALLSRVARVLLLELSQRPELAALLDLDESPNLVQLAYMARLGQVRASDLEEHVQWREGLGVLVGSRAGRDQHEELSEQFLDSLFATAASRFDQVVADLGRPRAVLPAAVTTGALVWVVTPSPLGMAALDATIGDLEEADCSWLRSASVVLNRIDEEALPDVDRFVEREYGIRVAGQVPNASTCWKRIERTHTLAPLCAPVPDRRRYVRTFGEDAWRVRQALEELAKALTSGRRLPKAEAAEA